MALSAEVHHAENATIARFGGIGLLRRARTWPSPFCSAVVASGSDLRALFAGRALASSGAVELVVLRFLGGISRVGGQWNRVQERKE